MFFASSSPSEQTAEPLFLGLWPWHLLAPPAPASSKMGKSSDLRKRVRKAGVVSKTKTKVDQNHGSFQNTEHKTYVLKSAKFTKHHRSTTSNWSITFLTFHLSTSSATGIPANRSRRHSGTPGEKRQARKTCVCEVDSMCADAELIVAWRDSPTFRQRNPLPCCGKMRQGKYFVPDCLLHIHFGTLESSFWQTSKRMNAFKHYTKDSANAIKSSTCKACWKAPAFRQPSSDAQDVCHL